MITELIELKVSRKTSHREVERVIRDVEEAEEVGGEGTTR